MNKQFQRGFSLLEVLISLVVVTIGLLGFAAMQGTAIQNSQSSNHTTLATTLAYDAFDRLRAGESEAGVTAALEQAALQNRFPGELEVSIQTAGDETLVTLSWADDLVGSNREGDEEGDGTVSQNRVQIASAL
jgi:type IV pilus modification protein PilV